MATPVIDPAVRLSRLPDEIQAQILSFLPAHEAVRTRVLSRAWRHVWKFTRRLLITGCAVREVREFVDRLLHFRFDGLKKGARLDECEIIFCMQDEEDYYHVNRWIHHSLKCRVQALRVVNEEEPLFGKYFVMSNKPLISRHLRRLELSGARFECSGLNLDGCPALEQLEIRFCLLLGVRRIMSRSLKRMVITECESVKDRHLFQISAPCLVSLWLEVEAFRAPLLESMPQLVEAHVRIDSYEDNNCSCDYPMGCYHVMRPGYGHADSDNEEDTEDYHGPNTQGCVLLEGLARAKHLVLLAHHSTYIFKRDLRMCPTFSNLRTLVLNGYWCEPADCRALACILEHAPVLENLTVIFSEEVELKYDNVLEGHPDATAKSTMTTQCLKTVKVKCHTVHDEEVQNVLKFLSTLNICFNSEWQKCLHEDETTIT